MTSMLSTIYCVAKRTYRCGYEVGNVMKSAIKAESNTRLAVADRTMTISEVSA